VWTALAIVAQPLFAAPATVAAAVANPARSADNVARDASRKPAEILEFLGLQPGMRAIDLFGGNRYWAEILVAAIGPKGQVTAWEPTQFYDKDTHDKFVAFQTTAPTARLIVSPFETPELGSAAYDFMMINLNYHDVYWVSDKYKVVRMEPDAWLKTIYAAMKPGGVVGVIDHVASAGGDPRVTVEKLHRIDPAVVRADFERAGFAFEAASEVLRNPVDDHSLQVFDEKIRGRTDRFAFRFRKPR
jgi:predicted methyltransferase